MTKTVFISSGAFNQLGLLRSCYDEEEFSDVTPASLSPWFDFLYDRRYIFGGSDALNQKQNSLM